MLSRIINLPKNHSFFLFGARGTGKTQLLKREFSENTLYIDLLNLETEAKYQLQPESLYKELSAVGKDIRYVVIDEIQKVPKLLDVVHRKIEESDLLFLLTGSSARKLKAGAANLLAGRAFVFHLFPFTSLELGDDFDLHSALQYGCLPQSVNYDSPLDKRRFLKAYANTYLKEEVWGEQLVRKIEPFRKFLQVAAQSHGQEVNYSKISRDVGVDANTIKNYYSILEDTLLGFLLPAYNGSVRKQLKLTPKFYLFDTGVKRAMEGTVDFDLNHGSYEYGVLFETLVIAEIQRYFAYQEKEYQFSYLATDGGAEIDLLISQGNKVKFLVEVKSATSYRPEFIKHIKEFQKDFREAKAFVLYNGVDSMLDEGVHILPWKEGIAEIVR
ncbi:MAG: ATP-binding protein [Bdellovibrionales bacterium]|nr:ATP-binding protein [Bdellovibrionales bacterium]